MNTCIREMAGLFHMIQCSTVYSITTTNRESK